jgi:hypothetical protein
MDSSWGKGRRYWHFRAIRCACSNHDRWIAEEEQEDRDDNVLPDFDDLVQNLLTSKEQAGRVLKLERVLDELKQSVSSRSTFSRFSFLVRLLCINSHYWVSNSYFDALLALLSDAFPSSNVPKSCEEACKYIWELGQGYESIHVCKNKCVLFWGDSEELQACLKCKQSRWEDANGSRRVSHKILRHFPLILRL